MESIQKNKCECKPMRLCLERASPNKVKNKIESQYKTRKSAAPTVTEKQQVNFKIKIINWIPASSLGLERVTKIHLRYFVLHSQFSTREHHPNIHYITTFALQLYIQIYIIRSSRLDSTSRYIHLGSAIPTFLITFCILQLVLIFVNLLAVRGYYLPNNDIRATI